MDQKLKTIIPTLTRAVETIMNPTVSSEERQGAHEICESFKDNTPFCIRCGFILASKEYSPIIRHFGLQLLEHSVRFNWNSLSKEEKETLKKNSLEMIAFGTSSVLEEHVHIKDAVSRVMVEIIKHEWPQLWPSLLSDFYNLCLQGEVQTELVLKVYLRLVEDVVIFQNLPTQRRREIMQALTANMADIFCLFITILQEHIEKAEKFMKTGENADKIFSQAHTRVSEAILTTMSGYLDWVNMSHILMKDNVLLQMLCLLLSNPSLQLQAAECLLIIVSRKGKLEDRKPILILFSEDAMCLIWNAAVAAEKESKKDEYYYLFLKRLCQVLTEIGKQLCALWGSTPDVKCPPNFAKYLEALLAFTQHPSQMLSSLTQQLWASFLRHEQISTEEAFLSFIPRVMESASKTLLKVGYPSQSNSVSCDYARLDFDSDEDFNTFYAKYRAEVAEIIRLSTLLRPKITFSIAYHWLMNIIKKPVDVGEGSENGNCNLSSPSFVDWDAMTVFLESVMSKLMLSDQPKPDPEEGILLLKAVLEYETQEQASRRVSLARIIYILAYKLRPTPNCTDPDLLSHYVLADLGLCTLLGLISKTISKTNNIDTYLLAYYATANQGLYLQLDSTYKRVYMDPLILSCLLSGISALFVYLQYTPETLLKIIKKVFSAVIFNLPGQTKATRSKAVKNVRQHACSALVKICRQYSELLFLRLFAIMKLGQGMQLDEYYTCITNPVFDELYKTIQTISSDPEQLSQMEKCILVEALILISNQYHNFEKQSKFLEEVLTPVKELWLSTEFKEAFWVPAKFMSYVGLDQAPMEPSSADTCGINRSHITYCINMILAVLKRSKVPEEPQKAENGGFVICKKENGSVVKRNPATAYIVLLMENVMALIKTMNALWLPENLILRHPAFSKSYDLLETEKLIALGIPPPCVDNTGSQGCKGPLERMQNFLTLTHDSCCHILGNACQCLEFELYCMPNLANSLLTSTLTNLDTLPDYRLRPLIRVFLKTFIQNCPEDFYNTAVIPVLSFLCSYMLQRLSAKWQMINVKCQTNAETEEENPESQEILEEQITRQLTREYMELLGLICYGKKSYVPESKMLEDEDSAITRSNPELNLGELGVLCMNNEMIYPSLVMSALNGLNWNDTATCHKCVNMCDPILKQLLKDNKMLDSLACHFFSSILSALQLHGEHEGSQAMLLSLGVQAFELLRPQFSDIVSVLLQVPNCTEAAVKAFEDKVLQKPLGEKKKKDAFKKLVAGIIGKNVGQQFKREAHYKNLPPLYRIRPKVQPLDEVVTKDMGICELFKPVHGNS